MTVPERPHLGLLTKWSAAALDGVPDGVQQHVVTEWLGDASEGAHVLPRTAWARSPLDLDGQPADTFVILLSGPSTPVVDCPNFGLQLNLCDGSFSTTKIFPVSGLPVEDNGQTDRHNRPAAPGCEPETAIGNFYVQFAGIHAAYNLPGGALTMVFTANNLKPVPAAQDGTYLVGTLELNITEATRIYRSFLGGHNHMVDILHQLADGTFVEHCFCIISRPK